MKIIESILFSVYHKEALSEILDLLKTTTLKLYASDGTYNYLIENGVKVTNLQDITNYPPILSGRVKSINPKIIGGIVADRSEDHLNDLNNYTIPKIDCVVIDLYPFKETRQLTNNENDLINKIDVGGVTMLRSAAKHFKEITVIPSKDEFSKLKNILKNGGQVSALERVTLAQKAFKVSFEYDQEIYKFYEQNSENYSVIES